MKKNRILSLMLALAMCVSLAAPAAAESAEGAVIQLTKTEGTVKVSKSSGKNVTLRAKLRLYKGYHVATEKESYAWINLDDTKLIKEDASSEVEVRKSGKKLEVNVSAGNVLFDVSEKLDDNESLNISTSTMVVGVRGTSGWVEIESRWKSRLYVLEGSVQCLVGRPGDRAAEVRDGQGRRDGGVRGLPPGSGGRQMRHPAPDLQGGGHPRLCAGGAGPGRSAVQ